MKYCEYFAAVNNEYKGFPKLNKFMFARMMNIVSLENRLAEVKKLKEKFKDPQVVAVLLGEEILLHEKLKKETYERSPQQILEDLIRGMIVEKDAIHPPGSRR